MEKHHEGDQQSSSSWAHPVTVNISKLTITVRDEGDYVRVLIASKIDYWVERIRTQLALLGTYLSTS